VGTVCESCVVLQRGEPMRDALVKEKRITKFHLEPSLACALRYPGARGQHKQPYARDRRLFAWTYSNGC